MGAISSPSSQKKGRVGSTKGDKCDPDLSEMMIEQEESNDKVNHQWGTNGPEAHRWPGNFINKP